MHWYAGTTWEAVMAMPVGRFEVLTREARRQQSHEDHRALVVAHSGDVKDLEERLRYAAWPEQAWWVQPADDDLVSFFGRARKP